MNLSTCLMWQTLLTWHQGGLNGEVFAKTGRGRDERFGVELL